jgi:hypothetical protein
VMSASGGIVIEITAVCMYRAVSSAEGAEAEDATKILRKKNLKNKKYWFYFGIAET